jgi:hypothetical protein
LLQVIACTNSFIHPLEPPPVGAALRPLLAAAAAASGTGVSARESPPAALGAPYRAPRRRAPRRRAPRRRAPGRARGRRHVFQRSGA